jgi:ferredoxin-NADP reductase
MSSPASSAPPARRPVYHARVERILDHAEDLRSLFIRTVDAPFPSFAPGMFISLAIPLASEVRVRPYTIASSPEDGEPVEIVFNRVPNGAGTAWLFERGVGAELSFTGPFGAFTLERAPAAEVIFIAEGTAIAPIRPMLRRLLALSPTHRVHLLYAAARADRMLYRAELESLRTTHPQLNLFTSIIEGGAGPLYTRLREEISRRWLDADADRTRQFYICGVGASVIELRNLLRDAGYERRAVHYERW